MVCILQVCLPPSLLVSPFVLVMNMKLFVMSTLTALAIKMTVYLLLGHRRSSPRHDWGSVTPRHSPNNWIIQYPRPQMPYRLNVLQGSPICGRTSCACLCVCVCFADLADWCALKGLFTHPYQPSFELFVKAECLKWYSPAPRVFFSLLLFHNLPDLFAYKKVRCREMAISGTTFTCPHTERPQFTLSRES